MIEAIEWDSDFFGYPVGKSTISSVNDISIFFNDHSLNNYKLIYLFSKSQFKNLKLKLVDTKLIFKKNIEISRDLIENSTIELYVNENETDFIFIEELAYLSGKYSRFKIDSNFKNNEFKKLYHKWVLRYTADNKNIIFKRINNIIAGFVLYSIYKETIHIELISVSDNFQGRGIASELIKETELIGNKNNCKNIQVVTQGNNIPAVNLYRKNKFNIISTNLIYHYWNI
jgi:dTDP-4-amino-4,6-dideoxy-D-galactose acyltransferase